MKNLVKSLLMLSLITAPMVVLGADQAESLTWQQEHVTFLPGEGIIPDAQTAIRVAIAVLEAGYGEENIWHEMPFVATLSNGIWYVHGTLPPGIHGGVAYARIRKSNGEILGVTHTQ